ncbi:hypothetical protein [Herbaspirillum autotrophicum]|uniref:hypothetical protein n=1 Tax=Herbaspirillum autotrophicum TaxID=180195 RepID=UPI00067DE88B|nr:hypothetical protein [Herbaspirillum autotrophicum]
MVSAAMFSRLWLLLQRESPVSYSSNLAHIVKSAKAAILLSQMLYWTRRGVEVKANHGWFYKRVDQWTRETGLTRHEQATARELLVALKFLEVRRPDGVSGHGRGNTFFRLRLDVIGVALAKLVGEQVTAMSALRLDDIQLDSAMVRQLLGKHVCYHRSLVGIAGSATAALLLSHMVYLQRKAMAASNKDWFSVTAEFYHRELGMNRRQLESARKSLLARRLIEEALVTDGIRRTRRLYQRIDVAALTVALESAMAASGAVPHPALGLRAFSGTAPAPSSKPGVEQGRGSADGGVGAPQYANDAGAELDIPAGLSGQELQDFRRWVLDAAEHRRQLLIDEFAYQRKRRVIANPVGYIRVLVQRDIAANHALRLEGAYAVARSRAASQVQAQMLKQEIGRTEQGKALSRQAVGQARAMLQGVKRS